MIRVLITGTSGTGKSTLVAALRERGYTAVDTDYDGYSELVRVPLDERTGLEPGTDWLWREDRIAALLATDDADVLFISGCAPNMGAFYDRFDAIVLLTASPSLVARRLATRTNNPYGREPAEVDRALAMQREIEPLLRRRADVVIDTSVPVAQVIAHLLHAVGLE